MKEHLLAIIFLGLLFLLYLTPMPEYLLKTNLEQIEKVDEQIESPLHNVPNQVLPENQMDSIQNAVVAATRL